MPDEKIGHTPGPWQIDDGDEDVLGIFGPDGDAVAYLSEHVFAGFGLRGRHADDANARLMSAAPELLAECKRALCAFTAIADWREAVADQIADDDCPYQGLASAIAKATGRS